MATVIINQTAIGAWPSVTGKSAIGVVPGGRVGAKDDSDRVTYFENTKIVFEEYPITGEVVNFEDSGYSQHLQLEPAGTLATITLTLPSDTNSLIGQEVVVFTTAELTAITWAGAVTIVGAPTTLSANTYARMAKVGADKWVRVG